MTPPVVAAVRTHQGGHPHGNEDVAWVGERAWLVADGMGGHHGGEVASATARDAVVGLLEHGAPDAEHAERLLADAVAAAGDRLRAAGAADESLHAMGTTLVAAVLAGDVLVVANVGDSRGYLLRPDGLVRLTRDDNVAEEMVELGMIDAEQAATHPGQYQLTKALTAYDATTPAPTVSRSPASGRLLLCSDGLTGELSDATLAGLLARGSVDEAADALMSAALRAPARDNVTVVVVDLGPASAATQPG